MESMYFYLLWLLEAANVAWFQDPSFCAPLPSLTHAHKRKGLGTRLRRMDDTLKNTGYISYLIAAVNRYTRYMSAPL